MKNVAIIVAVDEEGGFSKKGKIPWIAEPFASADLKHFQDITTGGVCIMGKRTAEDIAKLKKTPSAELLPGRKSYVLSTTSNYSLPGTISAPSIRVILDRHPNERIYLIGGNRVFLEGLAFADTVYMTIINNNYSCDQKFPLKFLVDNFKVLECKPMKDLMFVKYTKK